MRLFSRLASVPHKGRNLWIAFASIALFLASFLAVEGSAGAALSSNRLALALFDFENKTGAPKLSHWRHAARKLIADQISKVKSVRVLPPESNKYGYHQLKLKAGDPIDSTKARRIGEVIEARRVVWGSFDRKEGKWRLSAHVINVASGEMSIESNAASEDWFKLCDAFTKQLFQELRIKPSHEESLEMRTRPTSSSVALEWGSKGYQFFQAGRFSQAQECAGKALAADSQFVPAYSVLAGCKVAQGNYDEAEKTIGQGLNLKPDDADGHITLGEILLFQGKEMAALIEFLQAHSLDPDGSEPLIRLGEIYKRKKNWERSLFYFNEAKHLSPVSAAVQGHIGHVYALLGDQAKAAVALKEAERLDGDDVIAEQMLGQAYDTLHDTPSAIEHYDRVVSLAINGAFDAKMLKELEERAKQLKTTLVPVFLSAQEPKSYTDEALQQALAKRLSPEEVALVADPLASNEQMEIWARQLTQGATNGLDRGKRLFDGLARHIDRDLGGIRTARESFKDWHLPGQSFSCQEYARLYIALARSVGLRGFYTVVKTDVAGDEVFHACAALFIGEKVLLVDPTYRWFGAPHKNFEIVDDLQATANHLNQFDHDLARMRIAGKLDPASGYTQYGLALILLNTGKTDEATALLNHTLKFAPNDALADHAQGVFALHEHRLSEAVRFFRRSIEKASEEGMS